MQLMRGGSAPRRPPENPARGAPPSAGPKPGAGLWKPQAPNPARRLWKLPQPSLGAVDNRRSPIR
jgi:hypothetical protein